MSTRFRNFQPNDIQSERKSIGGKLAVAAVMGMVVCRKAGATLALQDELELATGKSGFFLRRDVADAAALKAFVDADVLRPGKAGWETPYLIGSSVQAEDFDEIWIESPELLHASMDVDTPVGSRVTTAAGKITEWTATTQEAFGIVRENIPAINTAGPARRFLIEIIRAPKTACCSPLTTATMKVISNSSFAPSKPDAFDIKLGRAFQKRRIEGLPLPGNRALLAQLEANPRRISQIGVRQRLNDLAARAAAIGNPLNAACAKSFFEGALAALDTDEHKKVMTDLVSAAIAGDNESRVELGRKIAVNVGILIRAAGTWTQWYEHHVLQPDEVPYLRNFVPQVGDVRVGTQDGQMAVKHVQPDLEEDSLVPLFTLISEVYVATIFDPYNGFIADAGLGTIDIAMDLMEKEDGLLQLPFTVGTANSAFTDTFVVDGTPAAHYHASSRIFTSNFPTGNIIAPSSNGANTKPRFDIIRAIDEYLGRFGNAIEGVGGLTTIHVASGIAHQFGDQFTESSPVNSFTEGLYANRSRFNYNGRQFEVVPDPTIDPTDKHVYVKGPAPAGLHFHKPAGDKVSRKENDLRNEVTTFERKLLGYAIPVTWMPRVLAVKFKT